MKRIIATLAAYITAFIVTYGHAYQQVGSAYVGENAVGAFISSIFWPLYWSIQVWK
jgi:hypothetical protein